MKNRFFYLFAATFLLTACATNSNTDSIKTNETINEPEIVEKEILSDEIIDDNFSDDLEDVVVVEEIIPATTAEELYLEDLQKITLSILSSPKEVKKGFAFTEPYVCFVSDEEGNPVSDFEIEITYPVSREDDVFTFGKIILNSDSDGKVIFTPTDNSFSAKTEVTFSPAMIETEDENVIEAVNEKSVKAPWLVKTSFSSALLFIWEYNELNKPTGNSYEIISALRKNGVWNVGNAPVNEKTDINKSKEYLYKANEEIVGKSFEYLIGGTIKFVKPVEKVEDGYEADLVADIYVINMKNGKEIYKTVINKSAIGANWNKAVDPCKTELSTEIVSALFYGL